MSPYLILGGPGCGKTERLLEVVEGELAGGVPSTRIGFMSFTRQATYSAAERAATRFDLDLDKDLPFFRTVHSVCYRDLGVRKQDMMGTADYQEIGDALGLRFSAHQSTTDGPPTIGGPSGDKLLGLWNYAQVTMRSLEDVYNEVGFGVDWFELKLFVDTLNAFKEDLGKFDFTDLLLGYAQDGQPLPVDVGVLDEAQDLSTLQWEVVERAYANAERLYVAGDDDQAIHRWAGADVDRFLSLEGDKEVLGVSHRLPAKVFNVATDITDRIGHRYAKNWQPSDREGAVEWVAQVEELDLTQGTWYLLARNGYHLSTWRQLAWDQGVAYETRSGPSIDPNHVKAVVHWERLRAGYGVEGAGIKLIQRYMDLPVTPVEGVVYHPQDLGVPVQSIWHDALTGIDLETREYYLTILRRGERLQDLPRVYIGTIHSVKGGEAENVGLLMDVTNKTFRSMQTSEEDEHRVFYVGATRARDRLYLVQPQSPRYYDL